MKSPTREQLEAARDALWDKMSDNERVWAVVNREILIHHLLYGTPPKELHVSPFIWDRIKPAIRIKLKITLNPKLSYLSLIRVDNPT